MRFTARRWFKPPAEYLRMMVRRDHDPG